MDLLISFLTPNQMEIPIRGFLHCDDLRWRSPFGIFLLRGCSHLPFDPNLDGDAYPRIFLLQLAQLEITIWDFPPLRMLLSQNDPISNGHHYPKIFLLQLAWTEIQIQGFFLLPLSWQTLEATYRRRSWSARARGQPQPPGRQRRSPSPPCR